MGAPPASLGGASGEVALVTLRSGDHAVVVAGHGAGHGLVEGEVAIGDVQRRTVVVAAHQQVGSWTTSSSMRRTTSAITAPQL
jgi:L-asparaginase/Glu-tRNA(Gln) amidotransferase subunit D